LDLLSAIKCLELTKVPDEAALKLRFHELALRYHPDKNQADEAVVLFRQVVEAYECCLANFDELHRHFGVPQKESTVRPVFSTEDIYAEIFGYDSSGGRVLGFHEPQKLSLTLDELAKGTTIMKKLVAYRACPPCKGSGSLTGSLAKICRHCFGQGIIKRRDGSRQDCPQCHGRGRSVATPCQRCQGFGRLRVYHRQRVLLPIGMTPGEIYPLESHDLVSNGPAQIFLQPVLRPHKVFQIENFDLLCQRRVDPSQCGKTLMVTTPLESTVVELPQEAKTGTVVKVNGAGLYADRARTRRGDLRVVIIIKKWPWWRRLFGLV